MTKVDYEIVGEEEQKVEGIVCNKCKNTLPPHTIEQHLDINHPIHACPHNLMEVRTLPIIEPVNYTMNVEVKKTKTKTKIHVELVIVEENDYMNELMECFKCNRNDIPRHLLHWNTNGSYTDTCQECLECN